MKSDIEVERPNVFTNIVIAAYLFAGATYFSWRINASNFSALWLSVPLYLAEFLGFINGLLFVFTTYGLSIRKAPVPPVGLKVDVFVPTYNESVNLLRRTLLTAKNMDYPHRTWLLDDGRRPEMRQLAEELDCEYLCRSDNSHAKAGNMNHALKYSNADLIAIFDADHAPAKEFLIRTLGYFNDERVAFVQTPQDFYNTDSFNHRKSDRYIWDEQALFFKIIQRGKDFWNSAFFCGSCAIIRRSALDKIGGFATETVTEDVHTAIRLHKLGYRSVYHEESLAFGLAPHSVETYLKQRMRWGMGIMQMIREENVLFCRGLTLAQRVSYISSALFYLEGWQKAVSLLTPPIVLLTGIMPISAPAHIFLPYFISYYFLTLLVQLQLGRGYNAVLINEQYAMTRFFAFMSTTLGLFRRNIPFTVTDKDLSQRGKAWLWLAPFLIVSAFTLLSVPIGIYRIWKNDISIEAGLVTLAWAFFTLITATTMTWFTQRHAVNRRSDYRFPLRLPITLFCQEKNTSA